MKLKLLSLALAICLCDVALHAQSLSEQNLIDLKKAGVDKAIMVQEIEKDGISFPMDAATTIRLKNLGFPDEVLSALINAGGTKSSTAPVDPVKTLYTQGKYPELCDYLKSQLASNPTNYRLRTILIGALLKIDQQPAALSELEKLRIQSQDPASRAYIDRASLLVSSWQKQQEGKKRLLAALQNYSYADANSAIDQLSASVMQKTILHMLVDSYAGKFDAALARPSEIQTISYSDKERMEIVKTRIIASKEEYKSVMEKIGEYIPLPYHYDGSPSHFSVSEYVDLVTKLSRLAPLSSQVLNLVFHVAMITSQYDNLQVLGDRILAAQGAIHIPFYSRDGFFDLVIDAKLRTISTQSYSFGFAMVHPSDLSKSRILLRLVPFDLAFDQITGISQKARLYRTERGQNSFALSFDPAGVAPYFALMHFLYLSAGEEAELQATRNLGQYILHVIGNTNIKAELANPQKASHGSGFGDALVALYAVTNGNTALGAAALQIMADNKAKSEMTAQQQQATWQTILARDYSSLMDGSIFDGLDKLVETTQ